MKQVVWTAKAVGDLRRIEAYHVAQSPDVARDMIARIVAATDTLLDFPGAGAPVGYRAWRRWRGGDTPYLLVYRPTRSGIEVVHVRHDRSGWPPE